MGSIEIFLNSSMIDPSASNKASVDDEHIMPSDHPQHCKLPASTQRLDTPSKVQFAELPFTVTEALSLSLSQAPHAIPPLNICQAAWALLLRNYTGDDTVKFGCGVQEEEEDLNQNGICSASLSNNKPIDELLLQIQVDWTANSRNQTSHLGFHGSEPPFNTGLLWRSNSRSADMPVILDTCDIVLLIQLNQQSLKFVLNYQAYHFLDEHILNIAHTFKHSLWNVLHLTQLSISQLESVSPEDREQIHLWNQSWPRCINACVHEVIQHQRDLRPEAPAVSSHDGDLTYAELDSLSSRVAGYLLRRDLGIEPDTVVPLCFLKGKWAVIVALAVLKAGAGILFLDSKQPPARLNDIVRSVSANIIICEPQFAEMFRGKGHGQHVVIWLPSFFNISSEITELQAQIVNVTPQNIALVIPTSGTTGRPKLIAHEHHGLSSNSMSWGAALHINPSSRVLSFASWAFDMSVLEIFETLMNGGCVCIPSEEERLNDLASFIGSKRVTWAFFTPSFANSLDPGELPTLKTVAFGGELLTHDVIDYWSRGNLCLLNIYGPAEGFIITSIECLSSTRLGAIGNLLGCLGWIVHPEDDQRLLPIGAIGELLIEGPNLARGYFNDQERTNASFIVNPRWIRGGAQANGDISRRLYKTGDLAKFNPDGTLDYVGRKDTQVKIHGQRVEPGEIEHHLRRFLSHQVVVDLIVPVDGSGSKLAAFILLANTVERDPNTSTLVDFEYLAHLHPEMRKQFSSQVADFKRTASLPSYMIPDVFIPLQQFPVTSSGKTDRRKLRELGSGLSVKQLITCDAEEMSMRQPSTVTEKRVQRLWADVLNVETKAILADHTFFGLGGDSISALRLVAAARKEGLTFTVADLFRRPKLADLSRSISDIVHVEAEDHAPERFDLVEFVQRVHPEFRWEQVYTTTFAQTATLLAGSRWPEAYHFHLISEIKGPLDIERLREGCRTLMDHYPILRTIFYMKGETCLQAVAHSNNQMMNFVEFDNVRDAENAWNKKETDFLGRPLTTFSVVPLDGNTSWFSVGLHHAQCDGWMISLFLDDIRSAYLGLPLRAQTNFISYAQEIERRDDDEASTFWRRLLDGSNITRLSADTCTSGDVFADDDIPDKTCRRKIALLRGHSKVTFASVLHSAWALALANVSKSLDVLFITVSSGRNIGFEGVADVMGPCPNVVPLRFRVDPNWSYLDLLEFFQTQYMSVLPFETSPFSSICQRSTDWPFPPAIGSLVNLDSAAHGFDTDAGDHDSGLSWRLLRMVEQRGRCGTIDTYLLSRPEAGAINLSIQYNPGRVNDAVISDLMDQLCQIIDEIYQSPTAKISLKV